MLQTKSSSGTTRRARSATPILTKPDLVTTVRACASCCSCRPVSFVVRTAITPTRGTWKDGTYISAQHVISRLAGFAPALRAMDGGLTISGGEPMVQLAFTRRILAGAKRLGLHTAIETSGFLGARADDRFLSALDLVLLDIKSSNPETYRQATGRELMPTLRFAERLAAAGKPTWVRFTLVPGLTDDPANVEGVAKFAASLPNVEWVEVQPFHQLGAFKWKAIGLDYKHADTASPSLELISRVVVNSGMPAVSCVTAILVH